MRSRHRSPGDGVRSKAVASGLSSSRISPENSMRGHGMHNSDYRSFNRGFGRGPSKTYRVPPAQPPSKADILMEAGRLAAEYLVSQGLLPPNVLPSKLQNGKLPDFKVQDRENKLPSSEGRPSVLSRLGNFGGDSGPSRKRFVDDFALVGLRNPRARRRSGSFRGHGSDWGKENERTEPWLERSRESSDMQENDGKSVGGHQGERRGSGSLRNAAEDTPSKSETTGDSESQLGSYEFPNDAGVKEKTSSNGKEPERDGARNLEKGMDNAGTLNVDREVKDNMSEDRLGEKCEQNTNLNKHTDYVAVDKQNNLEEPDKQIKSVELDQVRRNGIDLLRFCSLRKFPTKARSSVTSKSLKMDKDSTAGGKHKTSSITTARESEVCIEAKFSQDTASNTAVNQPHTEQNCIPQNSQNPKDPISGISDLPIQSLEEPADLDTIFVLERERRARSQSFSDRSTFRNQEPLGLAPAGFERSRSLVIRSKEESFVQSLAPSVGGTKRTREWDLESDAYFHLPNLQSKQIESQGTDLSGDGMANAVDVSNLVEVSLFPEASSHPNMQSTVEKQQLPSSFKICDLNLTESCEVVESPIDNGLNTVPSGSSILRISNETSVDVGLSMSNNFNNSDSQGGCSNNPPEKVIVDVPDDDDDPIAGKGLGTLTRKTETMYPHLENFLNQNENAVDLSAVPDNYGFGYSEFLTNDISNCSSVPPDITDLQPGLSLHNQEVIPGGEDDQLFFSLGEIPLSFLGVWDQSNQEYGKSF